MNAILQDLSTKSHLAEHWVENLINPVFLMMVYVQAEFFSAGHWNYARDSIVYMRTMMKLCLIYKFLNGEYLIHLKEGLFIGIWSDIAFETIPI